MEAKTRNVLLIGAGSLALLGLGWYFFLRPSDAGAAGAAAGTVAGTVAQRRPTRASLAPGAIKGQIGANLARYVAAKAAATA